MKQTKPVVIREQDCETEDWSKIGKNLLTWKTLISADRTPTDSITMGVAEFKPGGTANDVYLHRHKASEAYYILSGIGFVSIDGKETKVSTGTAVFVPSNSLHAVGNDSNSVLRILYVFGVNSFDEVKYIFLS
ncbi:MAG: cupin domain-containing protein [bacterium]|nr:cupin domain-containing protein [bacterium]